MTAQHAKTTNLMGFTASELGDFAVSIGEQKYRGKQLFDWIYTKGARSFGEISSLSGTLREKLAGIATIDSIRTVETQQSRSDGTTKFLFELSDGARIESVLIPPKTAFGDPKATGEDEQKRLTLCLSTQAGCPLDCRFCATATMGLLRNLTAGEIVSQVMEAGRTSGRQITNLVYMGMGEPLMNFEAVMKSVEIITTGLKIAARRITVSTAGWAPRIRQMADEGRKVKLAVSLHSLDPRVRTELMPVNEKFGIDELLDAVAYYYRKLKQRVTFEMILFDGLNDREDDLERMISLARRIPCKFNIIPFHSIMFTNPSGLAAALSAASPARVEEFVRRLRDARVTVFIRSSAGEDIDAACGQLAVKAELRSGARRITARRPRTSRTRLPA